MTAEISETERKNWLGHLARAPHEMLVRLFDEAVPRPTFTWLRAPEIGSVLLRGRTGGDGAAFNFGEMTVTRCALKLSGGEVGHGYIQGRNRAAAEVAALTDALMQTSAKAALTEAILHPIQAELENQRKARTEKAAATRVEFFTMVRGENA